MSTATKPSPSESRRYVDYDEFIDFQVQKTRVGIKSNDLLTAAIGAAVAVLAYVLVFAVFDHWVLENGFARPARIALLSILLVGLSVWLVWKLAVPYFRKVSDLYAAKEIELTEPTFRSTLLTLVDLKRSGRNVSPEIRAVLEKRAGLGLTHMNIEQAVDRRLLMRLSYVLLGLVVVTCLYTILSPKSLTNSLWRSLLPTAAVAVDTRTRIDSVEPGDVDVLARSQLEVKAELSGVMPEEVTLLYSTADHSLVDEPITMRETEDGIRQFRGVITGENGRGILQNLTYRITAGDAQSESYTVTVSQPPSATVDEVEYEYPEYMGFRDRVQLGGAIDGWEGTWVTVRATANMPVKSATVKFSDTDDISQKAEELPVEIENGTQLTARWQLRIRSDGTYSNFYRIQCRNDAGKTDPSPALHSIKIRPDQPPQIQLAQPTSDLERPANAVVPLLYAAQDPDFLLRTVTLRFERNGESLPQSPRLFEGPPLTKSVTGTHELELAPLDLKPGDKLTFWLEARDNMQPFADRSGNRANTPKLNITITEPTSPEEVEQQLAEDRQQVEERLEEAQEQSGDGAEPTPADAENAASDPPPPPNDAADNEQGEESGDAASGEQAESGEQQGASQPGEESSGQQQQQDGSKGAEGEQSEDGQGNQQRQDGQESRESQSGEGGDEDVPFDDLLKRLMQREQQEAEQNQNPEQSGQPKQQPQADDQPQKSRGDQSPSNEQPQPEGEQGESAQPDAAGNQGKSDESAGSSADHSRGEGTDSSSPQEKTAEPSPSAGDTTQPTEPNQDRDGAPRPGEGSEPSPDVSNPDVREGKTEGGQPSQDDVNSPSAERSQPEPSNADGARREPSKGSENQDPMTSRKNGEANPENRRPAPEGTEGEPSSDSDPMPGGEQRGEKSPQSPSDPSAAEQAPSEPSNSSGQPPAGESQPGEPQSGKPSGSQPPSESQPSGNQKQSGKDAANSPSPADPSGQENSQPSEGSPSSPQQGSESSPMGEPPDGSSPSPENAEAPGQSPEGDKPSGEKPSPADSPATPPEGEQQSAEPSPGESQPSESPGGESSPQEGQGAESQSGGEQPSKGDSPSGSDQSGEGAGQQPGGGGEQPGGGQKGSSQPGGKPGQGANQNGASSASEGGGSGVPGGDEGTAPGAGAGERGEQGTGEGEGGAADNIQGDDPDLEAKRKAANLVLKRLQEQLQRGEIDPALQEELGVTDEQMRDFTERLQQRLNDTGEDTSPEAESRRRQFQQTLENIDFESTGTQREGGDGPRKAAEGFSGPQRTVPLKLRDSTREFRERLSRRRPSSN